MLARNITENWMAQKPRSNIMENWMAACKPGLGANGAATMVPTARRRNRTKGNEGANDEADGNHHATT